jgi:hypothetical protein
MAEKPRSPEPPDSENMARFKRTLTALVAVPKDEAFAAYLKKNFSTPKRLLAGGKVGDVEPEPEKTPPKRTVTKRSRRRS